MRHKLICLSHLEVLAHERDISQIEQVRSLDFRTSLSESELGRTTDDANGLPVIELRKVRERQTDARHGGV